MEQQFEIEKIQKKIKNIQEIKSGCFCENAVSFV